MFTAWLRKYFNKQITLYGCTASVNYLATGLPKHWCIRNGVFITLDTKQHH